MMSARSKCCKIYPKPCKNDRDFIRSEPYPATSRLENEHTNSDEESEKMNNETQTNAEQKDPSEMGIIAMMITFVLKSMSVESKLWKGIRTKVGVEEKATTQGAVKAFLKSNGMTPKQWIENHSFKQLSAVSMVKAAIDNVTIKASESAYQQLKTDLLASPLMGMGLMALEMLKTVEAKAKSHITNNYFQATTFDEAHELGLNPECFGLKEGDFIREIEVSTWSKCFTNGVHSFIPKWSAQPAANCSNGECKSYRNPSDGGLNAAGKKLERYPNTKPTRTQYGGKQARALNMVCTTIHGSEGTFNGCGAPLYFKSSTLNMTRLEAVSTEAGIEGKVWRAKATPVRYPVAGQSIVDKMAGGLDMHPDGFNNLRNATLENQFKFRTDDKQWHRVSVVPVVVIEQSTGKSFIDFAAIRMEYL